MSQPVSVSTRAACRVLAVSSYQVPPGCSSLAESLGVTWTLVAHCLRPEHSFTAQSLTETRLLHRRGTGVTWSPSPVTASSDRPAVVSEMGT